MVAAALSNKTVMIATSNKARAKYLQNALEAIGASVVYSCHASPNLCALNEAGKPAFEEASRQRVIPDVMILDYEIDRRSELNAALEVISLLGGKMPIIVSDSCDSFVAIQLVRNSGAKYVDLLAGDPQTFAAAVAETVAQYGSHANVQRT